MSDLPLALDGVAVPAARAGARRAWWGAAALLAAVLIAPLGVVQIPPLLDYPNHLARMVVLANPHDPYLATMYRPRWGIIPDLGIDLLIPPLLHVLPVYQAGRLALAACLLLPLAGVAAYHRALFGVRSFWPLAAALVACHRLFLLGFMNFSLSMGLALLVAAAWTRLREPHPRAAVAAGAVGAVATFFCHIDGAVFLAILLGAAEAELAFRRRPFLPCVALSTLNLAAIFAAPAVLYLAAPFAAVSGAVRWGSATDKALGLMGPFCNYYLAPDILSAALVLGVLGWCLAAGRLRVPPRSAIGLGAPRRGPSASPDPAKGGAFLDGRFPIMMGFLLFAGTLPRLERRQAPAVAAGALALLLARTAIVGGVWHEHGVELAQLRASIAAVPPGAKVIAVRPQPKYDEAFWEDRAPRDRRAEGNMEDDFHMPALLVIERRAFWPILFTSPAQQPLAVRTAYRAIAVPNGVPPDYRALSRAPTPKELKNAPYLAGWRQRFDYVLVIDADGIPDLPRAMPAGLTPVNDTGYAALYKISGNEVR